MWIHLADREGNAHLCMAMERNSLSLNHTTCVSSSFPAWSLLLYDVSQYSSPSLFADPTPWSSVKLADGWCPLEMEISMHAFPEGITMPFHELSYDSHGDQQGVEVANCGLDTRDRNR